MVSVDVDNIVACVWQNKLGHDRHQSKTPRFHSVCKTGTIQSIQAFRYRSYKVTFNVGRQTSGIFGNGILVQFSGVLSYVDL